MWKDIFNLNFIGIILGLQYLTLFATCEPVCFTRISLDERNRCIERVDCDGTDEICWRFASRKDVKLGDLLSSRCSYPEDYPVTPKYDEAITCSATNLPTVSEGSFDCANKSEVAKGEACNLTCNNGFYPANSNQTVCEAGRSDGGGEWSKGQSFECHAITCQKADLPTVKAGYFNCSGNSVGDRCNLTCDGWYSPSSSKETVCEETIDNKANWTAGNFQCFDRIPIVRGGERLHDGETFLKCNIEFDFEGWLVDKKWTTSLLLNCQIHAENCNEWNQWNGHEYKYISTQQSWQQSRELCENSSSHLVTIESEEENEFLLKIGQHCHTGVVWIGLNDIDSEGTWKWSDGTVSTYTNWDEYSPFGNPYLCVNMVGYTGVWVDELCGDTIGAVCETNNRSTLK